MSLRVIGDHIDNVSCSPQFCVFDASKIARLASFMHLV